MIDPMCKSGNEAEITLPYLLCFNWHTCYRIELLNDIYAFGSSIKTYSEKIVPNILLYESLDFHND